MRMALHTFFRRGMAIRLTTLLMASMVFLSGAVVAAEADDVQSIKQVLNQLMPQAVPDSIAPSDLPGMYQVVYGSQVLYVSSDGRYMLQGDLFDLANRQNLTETARRDGRKKVIASVDPASMIIFKPEQAKYVITAFTDIDCGYCRKMHSAMAEYNKLGIEMRYLAYPRSGVNTPSYYKAVSVWCSDNQQEAMTQAKSGVNLPNKECANPVQQHMALGQEVGVSGTPTLVLENGQVIPGYLDPQRLLEILQEQKQG